jgi:hypothetical protein
MGSLQTVASDERPTDVLAKDRAAMISTASVDPRLVASVLPEPVP